MTLLRFERLTVPNGKAWKGMIVAAARCREKKNGARRRMDELEGAKQAPHERLFIDNGSGTGLHRLGRRSSSVAGLTLVQRRCLHANSHESPLL